MMEPYKKLTEQSAGELSALDRAVLDAIKRDVRYAAVTGRETSRYMDGSGRTISLSVGNSMRVSSIRPRSAWYARRRAVSAYGLSRAFRNCNFVFRRYNNQWLKLKAAKGLVWVHTHPVDVRVYSRKYHIVWPGMVHGRNITYSGKIKKRMDKLGDKVTRGGYQLFTSMIGASDADVKSLLGFGVDRLHIPGPKMMYTYDSRVGRDVQNLGIVKAEKFMVKFGEEYADDGYKFHDMKYDSFEDAQDRFESEFIKATSPVLDKYNITPYVEFFDDDFFGGSL